MFVIKLFAVLGVLMVCWGLAVLFIDGRPKTYRRIASWALVHASTLHDMRKLLERVLTWLDGRTFRELPGKILAEVCLQALENGQHETYDLIRIVELVKIYGTMAQKASFARAVIREAPACNPVFAPKLYDVLRRNDFEVGVNAYVKAELASAHAMRNVTANPEKDHKGFLKLARRKRVQKALKRQRESAPPRKRQAAP